MKKLSALFATLFLLNLPCLAQPEVVWGPELKEGRRVSIINIPGIFEGNTYVFKGEGLFRYKTTRLQKLDAGMRPVNEGEVDLEYSGKTLDPEFCLPMGSNIYMFSSFRNQKTDTKYLFVDEIDKSTLQPKKKARKISETPFRNRYNAGDFSAVYSRDSSHLLIVGNINSRNKEPEKYNLHVFTGEMELKWEKEVTLDYMERLFSVESFVVDNRGDVYLAGIAFDEVRAIKRAGLPNYAYKVLVYRDNGEEQGEYSISLRDQFITDLKLEIAPGGDLICAGFYSNRGTFSIKGSYYLVIDNESGDVVSESTKEFGLDFITMNFTARQEKKAARKEAKGKKPELYEYDLRRIVPRGDGGAVLIAEQYYVHIFQTYNAATKTYDIHYQYNFNDIIVVSIDPGGTIEWATKVPKRQVSVDDGGFFSSYATMITGGKLYFIYNDSDRNVEIEKPGQVRNFDVRDKRGIVMLASVDANGNVERKPLLSNREIGTITRPKLCRQISSTEMLLFGQRNRENQFGRLVFNDQ